MRSHDLYHTAYTALTAHTMRSLLTMLGIIIGVGSVILMVSLGRSFESYILDQISSFGENLIEVYPKGLERIGGSMDSITVSDYEAIRDLSTVENVNPVIFVTQSVHYGTEEENPFIFGTHASFIENYGLRIATGRMLDERDEKSAANVAVLSHETAKELFGNHRPVDKKITIGGRKFRVIGVLESVGSLLLSDLDTPIYIPFQTARAFTGQKHLSYIALRAKDDADLALKDITSLIRQRHGIDNPFDDPDKDDFMARSSAQATEIVGSVTLGLTAFLALIAGISLVVGGIGIVNIMLVSVSERTKEIGLRKALGARKRDILLQFLFEAVCLTLIGGSIGIVLGTSIGLLIAAIAAKFLGEFVFAFSLPGMLGATLMAGAVGLIFGIYPAKKAADLSPIEAMRWE